MKKLVLNSFVIAALVLSAALTSCEKVKDIVLERYTVTFDLNYAGSPAATTVKVEEGKTVSEPAKPTRTGWEFAGWFKQAAGTTAWNFATDVVTADVTLYAKWAAVTYAVTFNTNGGSAVVQQNVSYEGKVNQPANPTRSGYRFDGWFKDNNTFANAWNFANDVVTANVTIYAKWTQLFTVSFFTESGASAVAAQTVADGEKATKPPVDPTRAGYKFDGWYKDNNTFANAWNFANDVVTANATIYAKWLQLFTVYFDTDDGSVAPAVDMTKSGCICAQSKQTANSPSKFLTSTPFNFFAHVPDTLTIEKEIFCKLFGQNFFQSDFGV